LPALEVVLGLDAVMFTRPDGRLWVAGGLWFAEVNLGLLADFVARPLPIAWKRVVHKVRLEVFTGNTGFRIARLPRQVTGADLAK